MKQAISSNSSISTSSVTPSPEQAQETPFLNQGLVLWEQARSQWRAKPPGWQRPPRSRPPIDADDLFDDIVSSNRPFPQRVPLPDMVNVLLEIWEADGLLD
mmetsp:Transcript_23934/g.39351  ORF Transcript_23934/g.39351 Transcript_23934/m.39351 type:complete len:101 (-) Transcript_23934:412-714(-)